MTIAELIFWYATVFVVLLAALVVVLVRSKARGQAVLPKVNWRSWFGSGKAKAKALGREGWLKVLIATVIALSVGVIVALFVLPYGAAMAFGALSVTFITLILSLPKLFE